MRMYLRNLDGVKASSKSFGRSGTTFASREAPTSVFDHLLARLDMREYYWEWKTSSTSAVFLTFMSRTTHVIPSILHSFLVYLGRKKHPVDSYLSYWIASSNIDAVLQCYYGVTIQSSSLAFMIWICSGIRGLAEQRSPPKICGTVHIRRLHVWPG